MKPLRVAIGKKSFGTYLVNGKGHIVKFLEKRETINNAEEIYDLQKVLHEAAQQTNIPLTTTPAIPAAAVAESILLLSDAAVPLIEGDAAKYLHVSRSRYNQYKFSRDR